MMDKKYPDSLAGAVQFLRDESTLVLEDEPSGRPDPQVDGVWMIRIDGAVNDGADAVIVYLAGYADPYGRLRETGDFETGNAVLPRQWC